MSVTIIGNLTKDPELRFTPSGQATATFTVAENRRWQNRQSGEWQESATFIDVVVWREMAENATESLERGMRVIVTGRLDQRNYEDDHGLKHTRIQVVADEVAPSLRWTTASVRKNDRRTGPSSPPAPAAAPDPSYDEEPF